jgi:NAD(P)-dependent dehydrogenase (short-subunit alcohol dehydrogenase family)
MTNGRGRVVVTGAATGIGEATARHLRDLGFSVLAGVRRDEDAERLRDHGLTPIRLDVTVPEQIATARAEIGDQPLAGLVNNAGIACTGPLEFVPIEDLRQQLDVNVTGQLAVTQAFLDALRVGRGRIVNVGSISGLLATPITGPYVTSKFAMEGMTDVLRRELLQQGIAVVMVEPGGVKTPIMGKITRRIEQAHEDGSPELRRRYGAMITTAVEATNKIDRHTGLDPSVVAKVIGKALTVRRPRTRYLVGRDAFLAATMAKFVPDRVVDRLLLQWMASTKAATHASAFVGSSNHVRSPECSS